MRNPLLKEVLAGIDGSGKAQLQYLGLLALQAVVLFLWWPKNGVEAVLASGQSPRTLAAVVMALGLAAAWHAMRLGTEGILLPRQTGLRQHARAQAMRIGSILSGYVMGQLLHSVHLVMLSLPLVLMAFTVSGGQWDALGWCVAAVPVQALFYRLGSAIALLTLGRRDGASAFAARGLLLVCYVPLGLFAPFMSHLALSYRLLGEEEPVPPYFAGAPDGAVFVLTYTTLAALAALALYRLLLRERRSSTRPRDGSGGSAAVPA